MTRHSGKSPSPTSAPAREDRKREAWMGQRYEREDRQASYESKREGRGGAPLPERIDLRADL